MSCLIAVSLCVDGVFDQVVDLVRRSLQILRLDEARFTQRTEWYRPMAAAAESPAEEHAVINRLLAELELSHLALLEGDTYAFLHGALEGASAPTLGLQLTRLRGRFYASQLLEGGPAEQGGVGLGDRIVAIAGKEPEHSGYLVGAGGDPGLEAASVFLVVAHDRQSVQLLVQPEPQVSSRRLVELMPEAISGLQVVRQSANVSEVAGKQVGYLHLGYMAPLDLPRTVRELLEGELSSADGLVLDLRGRGGYELVANQILAMFVPRRDGTPPFWRKPLVVLIDRDSRSAKEVLAYYFKRYGFPLVGERTAGAVLAAGFETLSDGSVLMRPVKRVAVRGGVDLEGNGVRPVYEVDQPLEFARGADHIRERGVAVLLARLNRRPQRRTIAAKSSADVDLDRRLSPHLD